MLWTCCTCPQANPSFLHLMTDSISPPVFSLGACPLSLHLSVFILISPRLSLYLSVSLWPSLGFDFVRVSNMKPAETTTCSNTHTHQHMHQISHPFVHTNKQMESDSKRRVRLVNSMVLPGVNNVSLNPSSPTAF